MNMTAFVRGVCVGVIAGIAVDMLSCSHRSPKSAMGKAMARMGNAVDCALDDVRTLLH